MQPTRFCTAKAIFEQCYMPALQCGGVHLVVIFDDSNQGCALQMKTRLLTGNPINGFMWTASQLSDFTISATRVSFGHMGKAIFSELCLSAWRNLQLIVNYHN